MAKYIQKISFGTDDREWWVGWDIAGPVQNIKGLIPADSLSPAQLEEKGVESFQPVSSTLLARLERRSVQRVRVNQPFPGKAGSVDVDVVDVSAGGIGISHEVPLRPGKVIRVDFMVNDRFYSMKFELLRCQLSRGFGAVRYYSALRLHTMDSSDRKLLSELVVGVLEVSEPAIRVSPSQALALD